MDDEFICPNCNSKEILDQKFVSIEKPKYDDPWSSVTQIIKCANCKKKYSCPLR